VSGPLIPYVTISEIPILSDLSLPIVGSLGPITIKPFGALVASGVYLGWHLCASLSKRMGWDEEHFSQFVMWVVTGGFIGGHVFDILLYHNYKLTEGDLSHAIIELLAIWRSQASFGGFMGAILGMLVWKFRFKAKAVLPYCDVVASTFPPGWVLGRTGCSVAHDHPGAITNAWFAVKSTIVPGPWNVASLPPGYGRFDLGLIEMVCTIPLAIAFLLLRRKPRPAGFYLGIMCTYYAPVRFGLDFLRAQDVRDADPRHFGLTPAQWLAMGLLTTGLIMLYKAYSSYKSGDVPTFVTETGPASSDEPAPPSSGDESEDHEEQEEQEEERSAKKKNEALACFFGDSE
jgi:phosphatidylglycerol---prolipoprotein diacylglyceryl transferase